MTSDISKEDIVVLIPVYKNVPSVHEQICIRQTLLILGEYSICYIAPDGLDMQSYPITKSVTFSYFDKKYFNGLAGYNRLMLSKTLYACFSNYKYILVCQPDVFVFSDCLLNWAQKGYDYIGAPWITKPFRNVVFYVFVKEGIIKTLELILKNKIQNAVGNGGLSLRKTATFLSFIQKHPKKIAKWKCNEDFFWSFFTWQEQFHKPSFEEAISFCIETEPEYCLAILNQELPFGIHGWPKVNGSFFDPYIKKYGYEF